MITRLMDLQKKQDNLFKAFLKSNDEGMQEIWADKWRKISHLIQIMTFKQSQISVNSRTNHILKSIGMKIVAIRKVDNKVEYGLYKLEDNSKVSFEELLDTWRLK